MKEIGLIGATASGKTALAIELAHKTNSIILSLDSLCVYKEIDIASAKPLSEEQEGIKHFGTSEVYINEKFDVMEFLKTYEKAKFYATNNNKNLIIVGGTSFYLKILMEGISKGFDEDEVMDKPIQEIHKELLSKDEVYMKNISCNDTYRIQKAYTIYKKSKQIPSLYFFNNPKIPIIKNLQLYEIISAKEELQKRVKLRTSKMIKDGLINEVVFLEQKYHRAYTAMHSIGIIETLEYLDGKLTVDALEEKIINNTMKLAKRQTTFNKGQFQNKQISNTLTGLSSDMLKHF